MTKAILSILLFAYSISLVKPVLPYISDTVSHIFWYSKHVSTVHFENGKYHVHVEAMNAAKKAGVPVSSNSKTETGLSEHITSAVTFIFPQRLSAHLYFPHILFSLPLLFAAGDYPPPRR